MRRVVHGEEENVNVDVDSPAEADDHAETEDHEEHDHEDFGCCPITILSSSKQEHMSSWVLLGASLLCMMMQKRSLCGRC